MATMPRFTIMREDVSYVLAREYGDPRDSTTILAALLAIGGAKRVLILSDDDDGVWTLTSDITIPPNVTLSLPSGVTLTGTANLTIEGNLLALRTDWWQSTGAAIWSGSQTPWFSSRARMGQLALDIPLAITSGGTGASTVPQAQINLGIVPGTHVQPYDATLAAFAALAGTANTLAYFTNPDQLALTALTPLARTLIGNTTTGAMQATLGLGALAPLNAVDTLQIVDRAVTYAKMQNVTNARLLGRADSVAGPTQEITVGPGLTLTGGVLSMQGGAVSGSGAANRATFWTGVASQSYDDGYRYEPTTHLLTVPRARISDLTSHALIIGTDVNEAPGASHIFVRFDDTITNTPQWVTGLSVTQAAVRGAISPTTVFGITSHAVLNQNSFNASGTPKFELVGIESWIEALGGSGTIGTMSGLSIVANNSGPGTIASIFAIHVESANVGVLNNWYGMVLRNPPTVTSNAIGYYAEITTGAGRWNLYLAGSAPNYMLGALGVGAVAPADIPGSIYTPNWLRAGGVHSTGALNVGGATTLAGNTASQGWGAFLTGVVAGAASAPQGGRLLDVWGSAYVSANVTVGSGLVVGVNGINNGGSELIAGSLRVGSLVWPTQALDVTGNALISGNLGVSSTAVEGGYGIASHSIHCYNASRFELGVIVGGVLDVYNYSMLNSVRIGDHVAPAYILDVNGDAYLRGHTGIGTGYPPVPGVYHLNTGSTRVHTLKVLAATSMDGALTVAADITAANVYATNSASIGTSYVGYYLQAGNIYSGAQVYAVGTVDAGAVACRGDVSVAGNLGVSGIAGIGRGAAVGYSLCVLNMYANAGIESDSLYVRGIARVAIAAYPGYYFSAYNIYSGTNMYAESVVSCDQLVVRTTVSGNLNCSATFISTGYIDNAAGILYKRLIQGNPAYADCALTAIHLTGNWAGFRLQSTGPFADINLSSGGASLSNGAWVDAPSDRRIKRNIQAIDQPLVRLAKLHGSHYERTDTPHDDLFPDPNPYEYGLIAQDVADALPEAAFEYDYGDERGRLWNYTNRPILALLVEAVKDLAQQVAELKAAKEAA